MRTKLRFLFSLALAGWVFPAAAQWTTQTLSLQPGWNAVYLEIQPEPRQCQQALAGVPVESVWGWNRRFSSVQFIQDPADLVAGNPDWLSWVPGATTNLFTLEGGRAYLIKLPNNAPLWNWQIQGRPVLHRRDWISDSFNLAGFPVETQNAPTFQTFFAGSPAHAGQPIYRLHPAGHWEPVANAAGSTMRSGEAFWIRCTGPSSYTGPLKVLLEQGSGLDYGRTLTEQRLRIRNESGSPRNLTLQQIPSGSPPATNHPALAGSVPLAYFRMDLANQALGWVPLPSVLTELKLAAGEEMELRLEARRAEMTPYTGPNSTGALYQALLQISDNAGARHLVGVTSSGLSAMPNAQRRSGLWVGHAVIRGVNQAHQADSTNASPTAHEFQFRLIVHVDGQGQARLLQQVLQPWRQGPEGEPGRYVLLTDASKITPLDTPQAGRRISSTAFGFKDPVGLSGSGEFGAGTFAGSVMMDYDDPLNPFRHRYHPDHDNLDPDFHDQVAEAFTLGRQIRFEFTADDPEGRNLPGWGDDQLGGKYGETITGLHRYPLFVKGTFRLHRVSRLSELNPTR